ncbi:MAG: endonuclease MutS2 [Dehalococcoidia bacterium]|nr:endonuclease MutS2 [Dehalococcoidia bacterium]
MDDKSLEMLEFPRVREILARFTSFSASHELAINLQPLLDYDQVSLLLKQSTEARRLLSLRPDFSIGGIFDIRGPVKMAARGKILEPRTLIKIQQSLAAICQLRSSLKKLSDELPLLWSIAAGIVELHQVEKDIGNCITPNGEILDSASPELAMTRQRFRRTREQLLRRLETIIKSPKGQKIIQEPIVTQRDGRYVIPLKIESRKGIKGTVHDISNTGATVFVEPWTTVELGNELRELTIKEQREVERILQNLSNEIGAHGIEISHNIALVATLDLALSKAKYARSARATEPTITTFDKKTNDATDKRAGTLKLVEARHPLLAEKAVPLSVDVGEDFSILVITGPNTGGKTVALKTIGLLTLMTQAGIPVPASGESCIPIFDGVFADIGDEQNIEHTLSTFGWHIGNIVRIIQNTTEKTLVLLDELGTSTDPVEGSALARSILLHFLSKGAITIATTHYNDLKTFAHVTPNMQNASLDFNPTTLTPTYHLTTGIPGGSNALAIASHLGLPPEIISTAKEMLSKGTQNMETLLTDLTREKQLVTTLTHNLEKELSKTEQRNKELENELQRLKTEEQKLIQETHDNIMREAAKLQKEIHLTKSELRKRKSREGIDHATKALAAIEKQLKNQNWQAKATQRTDMVIMNENKIVPGDTVQLKETKLQATVLSISERSHQVKIQIGQTKVSLGLGRVEKITSLPKEANSKIALVNKEMRRRTIPVDLDLRGKRAAEIEWELDSYINNASLANLAKVRVIHGFGTGTVRNIVRDLVVSHPLVKSSRPGGQNEGGDGVTIINL